MPDAGSSTSTGPSEAQKMTGVSAKEVARPEVQPQRLQVAMSGVLRNGGLVSSVLESFADAPCAHRMRSVQSPVQVDGRDSGLHDLRDSISVERLARQWVTPHHMAEQRTWLLAST